MNKQVITKETIRIFLHLILFSWQTYGGCQNYRRYLILSADNQTLQLFISLVTYRYLSIALILFLFKNIFSRTMLRSKWPFFKVKASRKNPLHNGWEIIDCFRREITSNIFVLFIFGAVSADFSTKQLHLNAH